MEKRVVVVGRGNRWKIVVRTSVGSVARDSVFASQADAVTEAQRRNPEVAIEVEDGDV